MLEGWEGAVLFVVQREDAHSFAPNEAQDPAFAQALRKAAEAGVYVGAVVCRVTLRG